MTFAEQLTIILKENKLTMKDLSERYSIPYRTIQDWRAGRSSPPSYLQDIIIKAIKAGI